QVREGLTTAQGRLSFAPMTTDRLKITFFRASQTPPIQITDLVIPGVSPLPDVRSRPLRLPCGYGPKLRAGPSGEVSRTASKPVPPTASRSRSRSRPSRSREDTVVQTRATGTLGDLLAGRPLRFSACTPVTLGEGANRLAAVPLDSYRIDTVTVGAEPAEGAAARKPEPVEILRWGPATRRVQVNAAGPSYLVVNENFNKGWTATVAGRKLRPVRLDGWKQAWVVPAGTNGVVELTYGPDRAHRVAVGAGLALLLPLLVAAV